MTDQTQKILMYEDFNAGQVFHSGGRTITEHDVMTFAGLSGDFNPLHTDKLYARESPYQKRIAHGLLITAVVSGLAARLGIAEGAALALTSVRWKFKKPVFIDDTVYASYTVLKKKKTGRDENGFVKFGVEVQNQDEAVIQTGSWTLLIRSRGDNQGE